MVNGIDVVLLFLGFSVKHFLADYQFQSLYMVVNKGRFGHPGGILHAGIHIALSAPILWIWGSPGALIAALLVGEFVVHYHIDLAKENIGRRLALTIQDKRYWSLFGFDQLLHQLTYVAMIALMIR